MVVWTGYINGLTKKLGQQFEIIHHLSILMQSGDIPGAVNSPLQPIKTPQMYWRIPPFFSVESSVQESCLITKGYVSPSNKTKLLDGFPIFKFITTIENQHETDYNRICMKSIYSKENGCDWKWCRCIPSKWQWRNTMMMQNHFLRHLIWIKTIQ